jgi:CubicO group peptidase (beta-lactamase class C family)
MIISHLLKIAKQDNKGASILIKSFEGNMSMNYLSGKNILTVALLVSLVVFAGCARPPVKPEAMTPGDYRSVKEYISWLIRKEMNKNDVQGLSIALVDDQQVVWAEGFGLANVKDKISADSDTIYRLGSVSKLFTATAAMQLVEQGKLELDQPLVKYVPDFSLRTRFEGALPITLRHIMTHHSGIPSDHEGMWTKNPQPLKSLPALLKGEYAAFPPDTVFAYSNLGVSLLGLAVQNVSGQEFAAHMRQTVLAPLGMEHAVFSTTIDSVPPAASAYNGIEEKTEPPLRDIPAGGLNASVNDMSRFIRMILAGGAIDGRRIIKPETLHEMLRPQNDAVALDSGFHIGLGWMLGGLGGINIKNVGPVAHHGGATIYHRAQLIVLPQVKLGIIVLANSSGGQQVVNKIATETLKLAIVAKTGLKQPEVEPVVTGEFLSQDELNAYEGSYATLAGLGKITAKVGYLQAELLDNSFRLVPREDKQLQLQYRLLGLIPIDLDEVGRFGVSRKLVAGHEILTASDGKQEMLVGEKIMPIPIPAAWQQRVGPYEFVDSDEDALLIADLSLREQDGLLIVEYTMPEFSKEKISMVMQPLSDSEAIISGLGRGMGETVRVVNDNGVERLVYAGYHLKPVRK